MAAAPIAMWYIILTRPQQEQRAADNLARQGGEVYLPMLSVERIRRGKRSCRPEPLFPGYLFLNTDSNNPLLGKVRSTFGVRGLLRFGAEPATLADSLIEDIRQRCDNPEPPTPEFCAGDKVQFVDGPFRDYQALFQQYDGSQRAIVLLQLLGQQNRLLVDLEQLTTG